MGISYYGLARGNYTIASNGDYNYLVGGYTAAAVWDVQVPIPPPAINGGNTYSFSSPNTVGGGTITAFPGTLVTVTVSGTGSGGSCYTEFNLSGAIFATNSSGPSNSKLTASNGTNNATFIMPASGSITWSGSCNGPNYGSGSYLISLVPLEAPE